MGCIEDRAGLLLGGLIGRWLRRRGCFWRRRRAGFGQIGNMWNVIFPASCPAPDNRIQAQRIIITRLILAFDELANSGQRVFSVLIIARHACFYCKNYPLTGLLSLLRTGPKYSPFKMLASFTGNGKYAGENWLKFWQIIQTAHAIFI